MFHKIHKININQYHKLDINFKLNKLDKLKGNLYIILLQDHHIIHFHNQLHIIENLLKQNMEMDIAQHKDEQLKVDIHLLYQDKHQYKSKLIFHHNNQMDIDSHINKLFNQQIIIQSVDIISHIFQLNYQQIILQDNLFCITQQHYMQTNHKGKQ